MPIDQMADYRLSNSEIARQLEHLRFNLVADGKISSVGTEYSIMNRAINRLSQTGDWP